LFVAAWAAADAHLDVNSGAGNGGSTMNTVDVMAVIATSAGTVGWTLSRLDPVALIDRR
jgi:hypothetical protein